MNESVGSLLIMAGIVGTPFLVNRIPHKGDGRASKKRQ